MPKTTMVKHHFMTLKTMIMFRSSKNSSTQEQMLMPKTTMVKHHFILLLKAIFKSSKNSSVQEQTFMPKTTMVKHHFIRLLQTMVALESSKNSSRQEQISMPKTNMGKHHFISLLNPITTTLSLNPTPPSILTLTILSASESSSRQEQISMPKTTVVKHHFIMLHQIMPYMEESSIISSVQEQRLMPKTNNEETPLHFAASNAVYGEYIKDLINAGADIHAKDKAGDTPCDLLLFNDKLQDNPEAQRLLCP